MTGDEATMSLLEHLEELRSRIIVIAIAVAIAAIAGFFLADPLIALLQIPLEDSGAELIQTGVGEAFGVRIQLAVMTGIAFAMPVILYEIWAFVTPGLTRPERRLVWPLLLVAVILFAAGVALGYLLTPLAVGFLLDFSVEGVEPLLGLGDYIGFVTLFLLAFGIALQFPVILYLLARVGHPQLRVPEEPPPLGDPAHRPLRGRHHARRHRRRLVHAGGRDVRALRDHPPAHPAHGPITSPVPGHVLLLTDARTDAHASPGHPERPARREAAASGVRDAAGCAPGGRGA